jgi:rhodanese-related sulfurtransferase
LTTKPRRPILKSMKNQRPHNIVATMTVRELHVRLQSSDCLKPFVLDVRTPEELEIAAFDGAYLIPMHEIPFRMHEIPREHDVVILCRSGSRSATVWRQLHDAGFQRIWNLRGGILAWADEIDPTLRKY